MWNMKNCKEGFQARKPLADCFSDRRKSESTCADRAINIKEKFSVLLQVKSVINPDVMNRNFLHCAYDRVRKFSIYISTFTLLGGNN